MSVKGDLAKILLTAPACTEIGEKVALSRRIDKHWRLVGTYTLQCEGLGVIFILTPFTFLISGWGSVRRGTVLEVEQQ